MKPTRDETRTIIEALKTLQGGIRVLDKICEELGIKVGEEWKSNMGYTYKITEDGLFYKWSANDIWYLCDNIGYKQLITGELKPIWKPEEGEQYYVPNITWEEEDRYDYWYWETPNSGNNYIDQWYLNNNMIFRTKEEAIKASNKLIELYKEEYK